MKVQPSDMRQQCKQYAKYAYLDISLRRKRFVKLLLRVTVVELSKCGLDPVFSA
jgi:hypothetical protein